MKTGRTIGMGPGVVWTSTGSSLQMSQVAGLKMNSNFHLFAWADQSLFSCAQSLQLENVITIV